MGKLRDRLWSLFGRKKPSAEQQPQSPSPTREQTDSLADRLQRRTRRVSESLLDNETLTADLDDSAAKELIDWGLKLSSRIARGTADIQDDEQANERMYPRLRAVRRLMRDVNHWVASQQRGEMADRREALNRIIEQAQVVYGQAFEPPSEQEKKRFLQALSKGGDSPPDFVAHLRQLLADRDDA